MVDKNSDDKIKFEKKVINVGGSYALTIPQELINFLGIDFRDDVILIADKSSHGKYIAFWKKEDKIESEGE